MIGKKGYILQRSRILQIDMTLTVMLKVIVVIVADMFTCGDKPDKK